MRSPDRGESASPWARAIARARKLSPVVSRRSHDEFVRLFGTWFPVGHFYSPFPDIEQVERRAARIFDYDAAIPAVDFRESEQLALLDDLAKFAVDADFPIEAGGRHRYHLDNEAYGWGDGLTLHAMLRHIRPARVIEVGSGFSSSMILDTAEGWLGDGPSRVEIRFIEPYPALLRSLLRPEDEGRAIVDPRAVQDVPLQVFDQLAPGDVLFVDSTHVAKAGSDVNHIFFEVLPRLAVGVWVHLHDIFMPFEYPLEWIREGRAWQEAYLLRAFLMYNSAFEIRWFQSYMWTHHQDLLARAFPVTVTNPGGNIWLQRVA